MKDDLISRKDAVSRISDLLIIELKGARIPTWNEVYNAIGDVPSVLAVPLEPLCRYLEVYARTPIYNMRHTAEWWKEELEKEKWENWMVEQNADAFDRALCNHEFTAALNEAADAGTAFEDRKMYYSTQSFRDAMKHRPTIDASPVVRGTWLPVKNGIDDDTNPAYDCSECGAMCHAQHNFCPRCGAKMSKMSEDAPSVPDIPLDKLCEWLAKNASWYAAEIDGDPEEWKSILTEWMEELHG